jgi:peptidoglycan hydrolase-like protein with peptidoglycan-binding domain
MKRSLIASIALLLTFSITATAQNGNPNSQNGNLAASSTTQRSPLFRATKDQIEQVQAILRLRNFYSGEKTGNLDEATREGLKKYQEAEGLNVTGILNKMTLERMNIPLTDKQKAMQVG